jgi:23S rRNA (uracil1939-C5)-methyltransferase
MKCGEHVLVAIQGLTSKGDGIGTVDGKEVVVPRTVPGDQVVTFLKKKRKGRFQGEADAFKAYGLPRQVPSCDHFGVCGGCRWQDIAYTDQLALKEKMVHQALEAHSIAAMEILSIIPSPAPFFYRNKMEYSFGVERDGQMRLGLHVRGRYDRTFDVNTCFLQSEISNRIVRATREKAVDIGVLAYNQKNHQGVLRFLVIREGKNSGEILVNLVVSEYPSAKIDALVTGVLSEVPEIDTFVITLHRGKAQVAIGEQEFVLRGNGVIIEKYGGIEYGISPRSFFQTNSKQAEKMLEIVVAWAGPHIKGTVIDLYCGTGSFSLCFACSAKRVIGVESVYEAVEDAKENAARNKIENCEFLVGTVEDVFASLTVQYKEADLVVVDPPRAGIHKKALKALGDLMPPVIIYVSCNPETLAENLGELMAMGYVLNKVQPLDMFPQTPHCEVITLLTQAL